MIGDHVNRYLWSGAHDWIEQAARAVFPLFAMVLGAGLRGRRLDSHARQVWGLIGWALLAQLAMLPLMLSGVMGPRLNVLWTLAFGMVLIVWWSAESSARRVSRVLAWGVVLAASCVAEYGPVGVMLVWAAWRGSRAGIWLCLGWLALTQLSLVPLVVPAMFWACETWIREPGRSPKRLFAAGYVVQWVVIGVLTLAR